MPFRRRLSSLAQTRDGIALDEEVRTATPPVACTQRAGTEDAADAERLLHLFL